MSSLQDVSSGDDLSNLNGKVKPERNQVPALKPKKETRPESGSKKESRAAPKTKKEGSPAPKTKKGPKLNANEKKAIPFNSESGKETAQNIKSKSKLEQTQKPDTKKEPKSKFNTKTDKKQDDKHLIPSTKNGIPTFDLTPKEVVEPAEVSSNPYQIQGREDYGTKGTKVDVLTNQMLLSLGNDTVVDAKTEKLKTPIDVWWKQAFIYTYHIDFIQKPAEPKFDKFNKGGRNLKKSSPPNIPVLVPLSKPKKYDLIESLFDEDETLLKYKKNISFNGEDTIYSLTPLEEFTLFDGCWDVSAKQKKKADDKQDKVIPEKKLVSRPSDAEPLDLASQIILKFTSKISLKGIYSSTVEQDPSFQEEKFSNVDKASLLHLLGVKLRSSDETIFQVNGNKFFVFNEAAKPMPFLAGGYLMHGFTISLRYIYSAVALNVINTIGAFVKHTKYLPGDKRFNQKENNQFSLLDFIIECYQYENSKYKKFTTSQKSNVLPSARDLNNFIKMNKTLNAQLKGMKVHRPYINYSVNPDGTPKPPCKIKSKEVIGFTRETATSMKIKSKDRSFPDNISTTTYFKEKYNINLKYPDLQLVNLGNSITVPAECCMIMPGQKVKGLIKDNKEYMEYGAVRPNEKFNIISNLALPRIANGLYPDSKPSNNSSFFFLKVPSRIIDAPVVQYKNSIVAYKDRPYSETAKVQKGMWNLSTHGLSVTEDRPFNMKIILVSNTSSVPPVSLKDDIKSSLEAFIKHTTDLGMNFKMDGEPRLVNNFTAPKKPFAPRGSKNGRATPGGLQISSGEKNLVEMLKSYPPDTYILYLLNNNDDAILYNRLKYLSDLKFGVLNSCCQLRNFLKKSPQLNANLALKMNLKLLGSNQLLSEKCNEKLTDTATNLPVLILGADVTHYPEKDQNSIAAMVGSIDDKFSQFPGDYMLQDEPGEEIIKNIDEMFLNRLIAYQEHNKGKLPTKILYFRDGVSEGQLNQVVNIEIRKLKESARRFGKSLIGINSYNPSITCVVTVKRNQIRFMPLEENAKNEKGDLVAVQSMGNVMPGTVVDRGITSVAHFDYFLQSQQALKGTGVPCHYWCVYNENNYTSDDLQEISHNLCYIFGRSTTSIKCPAPIYYADLLCTRATCYFKANFEVVKNSVPKNKNPDADAPAIPKLKLLPNMHKRVNDIMYYI
ncbi:hypothetical protein TPHA_0B01610 [Tetrapisispora phaffii CBS 4417]|uniref:Piwi domain-containing protein n=1 Tax=Tetrapisispora phaffii (strain ATCC 24235 / CBS 4417 / NBRC 1672 / NRRL Y-8282 / UCD 70-5) TaxID=1071381 RepID=G8BPA3_TETPH|nr:hypothetical protein TPHA_0B01610 [Tetrapisispora phaffii CBS 4417]CCE61834.1 hypothetical protein TPHA_0B01610 [Tetrapisispora phaffii CBS 4417]